MYGRQLTRQEAVAYNDGERLVPGISHDLTEEVRHRSSYRLFRAVIEADRLASNDMSDITILDLGCGTGYGSKMLSEISGARIEATDICAEALGYAIENYSADNITYRVACLHDVIARGVGYDYVVSRHVLEHISDGFTKAASLAVTKRSMINVPYMERPGNPFHLVTGIDERTFSAFEDAEFLYEDLDGFTFAETDHPRINSIICVAGDSELPRVSDMLEMPFAAWVPSSRDRFGHLEREVASLNGVLQRSLLLRIERKILSFLRHK